MTEMSVKKITLIVCAAVFFLSGCTWKNETSDNSVRRDIYAMDTVMTVTAYGSHAKEAVDAAETEIKRLDALFSTGNKDSIITKLNENKTETVGEDCMNLIKKSEELYQSTEGSFDISVYPLMEAWGFPAKQYRIPKQSEIKQLLKNVDASKIIINEKKGEVTLPEQMKIDLGGIAKGYTSDKIMEIFRSYGVDAGMVSLGGNVQTYRTKPDGSLWKVGIENPDQGKDYLGILAIKGQAVVTSGGYERYFEKDGKRYHHIIDPKTGYPAETGLKSVTVVSKDGTLADGLSTAFFVMGKAKALDYWNKHSGQFDVILEETDGTITVTGGIAESFTSEYDFDVVESKEGIAENE